MANPFTNFLNNTIFGPPKWQQEAEAKVQRQQAQLPVFRKIDEMRSQNLPPKAIAQSIWQTPEGQDYFANATNPTEDFIKLNEYIQPKPMEVSPGASLVEPNDQGGMDTVYTAPVQKEEPEKIRTFDIMLDRAGVPEDKRQALWKARLEDEMAQDPNSTQAERAWQEILRANPGKPELVELMNDDLAGVIKTIPVTDPFGNVIGTQLFNMRTNKGVFHSLGGSEEDADSVTIPGKMSEVYVPPELSGTFAEVEAQYPNIPKGLLQRQTWAESEFNPNAKSPKGASGVSQFMPKTAAQYGVFDTSDPHQSIQGQGAYMNDLISQFKNPGLALMAYNWGPGNTQKWLDAGADPMKVPSETRAYLSKILGPEDAMNVLYGREIQEIEAQTGSKPQVSDIDTAAEGVFSVGPWPTVGVAINWLASAANLGSVVDQDLEDQRALFGNLRKSVVEYFASDVADGRDSVAEQKLALENVPGVGLLSSSSNAIAKLIKLRQTVEKKMAQDQAIVADKQNVSPDIRKKHLARIFAGHLLLAQIGSEEELKAQRDKASENHFGADFADRWNQVWNGLFGGAEEGLGIDDTGADDLLGPGPDGTLPPQGQVQEPLTAPAGQVEYDPNTHARTPDELRMRAIDAGMPEGVADAMTAFNGRVADVLSIPFETVTAIARATGMKSIQGNRPPAFGAVAAAFKRNLVAAGVPAGDVNTLAGKLGKGTVDAGLTSLAFIYAAPMMLARPGTALLDRILRAFGRGIMERPGQVVAGDLGANVGAQLADESIDSENPYVRGLGIAAGASIGGMTGAGVIGLGRRTIQSVGAVSSRMRGSIPLKGGPVRPQGNVEVTKQFSEQQLAGDLTKVQNEIEKTIRSVPAGTGSDAAQAMLRTKLKGAKDLARKVEASYWARVDETARIPMDPLRKFTMQMNRDLRDKAGARPTQYIRELLLRRNAKARTVAYLKDLRGRIRDDRVTEQAKAGGGNAALVANYNQLEEAIMDAMELGLPSSVPLKQARAISRAFNQMFREGPIGAILGGKRPGEPRVPAEVTAKKLLNMPGGARAITRTMNTEAITASEDAVRAMFREESGADPHAANLFIARMEPKVRELGKVHAEMMDVQDKLTALVQQQNDIQGSALAKYAQTADANKGIDMIVNSRDPSKMARGLLKSIGHDTDAVMGLRTGLIDKYLSKHGFGVADKNPNITGLYNDLNNPPVKRLMQEVLDREGYDRLYTAIDIAHSMARGDRKTVTGMMGRTPGAFLGRVLGATIMRKVFGANTIQATGAGANVGQNIIQRVHNRIVAGMDPSALFALAINDPKWERIMLRRAPTDTKELRKILARIRRFTTALEAGKQYFAPGEDE